LLRMLAFRPAPTATARSDAESRVASPPVTSTPESLAPVPSANATDPKSVMHWAKTIDALRLVGVARELAVNSVPLEREGNVMRLGISAGHAQLAGARAKEKLQAALCEYYGADLRLELTVAAFETHTPATVAKRQQADLHEAAVQAIQSDPNVAAFCEAFDARVEAGSVRPLVSGRSL
jgi:DNA polymerase-3 subunit gamma/tau